MEGVMRAVRRFVLLLSLVSAPFLAAAFAADKHPSRPVHWVVGFAAGGPNDIVARVLGEWLSAHLGQQFIIENRGGSGGMIAANAVINSPPTATPSCSSRRTMRSERRCTRTFRSYSCVTPLRSPA